MFIPLVRYIPGGVIWVCASPLVLPILRPRELFSETPKACRFRQKIIYCRKSEDTWILAWYFKLYIWRFPAIGQFPSSHQVIDRHPLGKKVDSCWKIGNKTCLVGALEHDWIIFHLIYGYIWDVIRNPLTNSIIFQDGYCTTNHLLLIDWTMSWKDSDTVRFLRGREEFNFWIRKGVDVEHLHAIGLGGWTTKFCWHFQLLSYSDGPSQCHTPDSIFIPSFINLKLADGEYYHQIPWCSVIFQKSLH